MSARGRKRADAPPTDSPAFDQGPCVLHHGDCLDPVRGLASLPDRCVDHVISDPPYESESHTSGRRVLGGAGRNKGRGVEIVSAPLTFECITEDQRVAIAEHAVRVARRWILIFAQLEGVHRWRDVIESAGARYVRTMVWIKPNGQPQLTGDRPGVGYECIVVAHSADVRLRWNGGGKRGFIIMATDANFSRVPRAHETQKPYDLMAGLVSDFTDPGDIILDPFAGSGTTGVAAIQLGRRFIGWERDAKYHAIAMRRLRGEEAKPNPAQPSLFGGSP